MKCEGCQVEFEPRYLTFGGREIPYPFCGKCEAKMEKDMDELKKKLAKEGKT